MVNYSVLKMYPIGKNDICYLHNNQYQYGLISMTISMNEKIKAVN